MMVDTQVRPSDVTKFPIIDAFLDVPREVYVPPALKEAAYVGESLNMGGGRHLLDPTVFAKILDALDISKSDAILDVGCGLGYSTAILAHMADFVVGLEDHEDRANEAQSNLSAQGVDNAVVSNGRLTAGVAESGPYDAIVLQGAVSQIPDTLTDQLRDGGRIAAIFMESAVGSVKIGRKVDGEIVWRFAFNASAPMLPDFATEELFSL